MSQVLAVLDYKKALQAVNANEALADDLLAKFISDLPTFVQQIQDQLDLGNKEELKDIIHKINGGLRYIGAPALLDIIDRTDMELFNLDDQQLKQNISKIFHEIERLIKAQKYPKFK